MIHAQPERATAWPVSTIASAELDAMIRSKADEGHTARLTAGFCWRWSDPEPDGTLVPDVKVGAWQMPWNARPDATRLTDPIRVRPPELADFGVAAGTLLATNLGAVLGIAGVPGNRETFKALQDATYAPWAQLGGAVVYIVLLGLAPTSTGNLTGRRTPRRSCGRHCPRCSACSLAR